jgi:aspartate/tyrosine/aromatic aminotransferase
MFEALAPLPPDPILGVTAAFRKDPSPDKVDLGVGVYRDEGGHTPVPQAVLAAERDLIEHQSTKTYVGPAGNIEFNTAVATLALGKVPDGFADRVAAIQTVGGCGALRVGAELIRVACPEAVVHVSDPTWANHEPLLGSSGLSLARYPYYDAAAREIAFDRMLEHIDRLPTRSVVLVHACCHNPTGADLDLRQWQALTEVLLAREHVPFIDLAYQGLGDSLDDDAAGLRHVALRVPEMLLAISCSKNFGLYKERVGALVVLTSSPDSARALATHQARTGRRMYSMPPDHGAAIVARVLTNPQLRASWEAELAGMTARLGGLRNMLVARLAERMPDVDFSWLARQKGMFSLLGLPAEKIGELQGGRHVYMPPDGRINVAGLNERNVGYVADSLTAVLRGR